MSTPEYLFERRNKAGSRLIDKITSQRKIILLLDYDGTLVPIKKKPSLALLSASMHKLLKTLAAHSNFIVIVVTGRSFSDIKKLIGIKNIIYASNHGFQISGNRIKWIHPGVERNLSNIKKISFSLNDALKSFPATFVEDKKLTLSVHFRNEKNNFIPVVKKIVAKSIQPFQENIIKTTGKKVIEIRPNINWNKGKAVLKILTMLQHRKNKNSVICLGDDKTDEDAFRALKNKAITIHVGSKRNTQAHFYLYNSKQVKTFLEMILLQNKIKFPMLSG
ncbi:MAG: trehalose-phosphatase [Melioribacter sp.]|nr:trehalose-phosphatase [Melioribacter sp.]